MIDASTSMRTPFKARTSTRAPKPTPRSSRPSPPPSASCGCGWTGRYRDLVALVEFGNEAYVVTPFTNDYDNILLSISLIGDPVEYSLFPDQGTIIAQAIDQSVGLFKAFNFLDASGNLMVIFTDGEDTRAHRQRADARRDRAGVDRRQDSGLFRAHELRARARAR